MDIRLNYIILQSIEGHEHIFLAHDGKEMRKKTVKKAHAAPPPPPPSNFGSKRYTIGAKACPKLLKWQRFKFKGT